MKRLDDGKVSFVEFLSSIKFARHSAPAWIAADAGRFAPFEQRVSPTRQRSVDDPYLVRSAN